MPCWRHTELKKKEKFFLCKTLKEGSTAGENKQTNNKVLILRFSSQLRVQDCEQVLEVWLEDLDQIFSWIDFMTFYIYAHTPVLQTAVFTFAIPLAEVLKDSHIKPAAATWDKDRNTSNTVYIKIVIAKLTVQVCAAKSKKHLCLYEKEKNMIYCTVTFIFGELLDGEAGRPVHSDTNVQWTEKDVLANT